MPSHQGKRIGSKECVGSCPIGTAIKNVWKAEKLLQFISLPFQNVSVTLGILLKERRWCRR